MDYIITKHAQKDIKTLQPTERKKISRVIENIEQAKVLKDIPNIQKIKGCKEPLYRIKVTPYRVFFILVTEVVNILSVTRRNEKTYKKL